MYQHYANNVIHAGGLLGHQDWITGLDVRILLPDKSVNATSSWLLASASQDAKIRLWNFKTRPTTRTGLPDEEPIMDPTDLVGELDNEVDKGDDDGDTRLEIVHEDYTTRVTWEALLMGHESSVTAVAWHPNPKPIYGTDLVLVSSSMDRSILLWACCVSEEGRDGIWTPETRVGSAGGILGGSIGSTLVGYCGVAVEPRLGQCIVGHAYGGALHAWSLDQTLIDTHQRNELSIEERATKVKWRASPGVTGHFESVTDLSWEAGHGDYLLTVSNDQTCRLWAPVGTCPTMRVWAELARPQVHGYNLSSVISLSTPEHPHRLVSGAEEKEIRVFEAPMATMKVLKSIADVHVTFDPIELVARAYIT